ncbi:hypothetical protein [Spirosoma sp. KNUC1025]|uniref:hypothetical protein n=1 Tax=Spirosoma sp. KNUC1025 TaxID=2894082 RepID=UPI00386F5E89|nr:hypothetical protein LN737_07445 [Spirosoma sp. KNUC1025]
MKHLLILILLSISTFTMAQSSSRLKTRIVDNSQTLSIQIDGNRNGRSIHYKQTFDVEGMTTLQKDILKYRAFTSQNVMPPLHDMAVSIATILVAISLVVTFLIVGYQSRKTTLNKLASN